MPEANWLVAIVFSSFRLPTPLCLQVSIQIKWSGTPNMPVTFLWCWLRNSKGWDCSLLPHGEGMRTLCKIFNTFFFHSLGISVQKSLSVSCIQPLKSLFSPRRRACLQSHYKCSLSMLYRKRTGQSGLSFNTDFWVARDTSPLPASRGAGALARAGQSPV